jgi:activator of HSP90 ATPase
MDKIKVSAVFNVSAKALYSAWMNSKKHSEMTGGKAKIINRIGCKYEVWDKSFTGKTLNLEPFKRIIQSWRPTNFSIEDSDSLIEILFDEAKGKTKLTLIHTGIPKGKGAHYKQGWIDYYFTPMKKYFEK